MSDTHKNVSTHPVDLDDGSVVAPGDFAKLTKIGPTAQSHIDAGALLPLPSSGSAARSEGGDKSASKRGS